MMSNKIYEPIRRKIEEWIDYDVHSPNVPYRGNEEVHDEYRRWHDRDCVLVGGDLNADTMFSLWLPLRHTITRINDTETIRAVGNISGKYDFLRDLNKGDNLEKLLPEEMAITSKLSILFELGMRRENIFILPARQLNSMRGGKPYWDYVPAFLLASFPGGEFAHYWSTPKEHLEWIEREYFQVFFDGDISPENIKDLSGSGEIRKSLAPDGIQPMEDMIDNYIAILQERKKYFTAQELENAARMDEMMHEESRIQAFKDRIVNGEPEALMQVKDVMDI